MDYFDAGILILRPLSGQSKVSDLWIESLVQQNVGALDVAVYQRLLPVGAGVQKVEAARRAARHAEPLPAAQRRRALFAAQTVLQRPVGHELVDQTGERAVHRIAVDRQDVVDAVGDQYAQLAHRLLHGVLLRPARTFLRVSSELICISVFWEHTRK